MSTNNWKNFLFFLSCITSVVVSTRRGRCPMSCSSSTSNDINKECYRTFNGSYNNLENPSWGQAHTAYSRFLENSYSDGKDAYPRSVTGEELPNPREISLQVFPYVIVDQPPWTLSSVMWGQLMAHDMSLTDGVPQTNQGFIECCDTNGQLTELETTNPRCASIILPKNDPYNAPEGRMCMNFVRTRTTGENNSDVRPFEPKTAVTAFIDLSPVYDNSVEASNQLREFKGGRMKISIINNKNFLPTYENPGDICTLKNLTKNYCFRGGDVRTNQNTPLTLLQTMLVRAHNKIADNLCKNMNKHWSDEKCFQETRRILIAMTQHITYYEFLPFILGLKNIIKRKIYYEKPKGYINDYDSKVNPSIMNEHATAAYRLFHSSIQGFLKLYSSQRKRAGELRLSTWFDNPTILTYDDIDLKLAIGQSLQIQGFPDRFMDQEVSQFLFRVGILGLDLKAIDITRSRDHGLGSYVAALKKCGLSDPKSFEDFEKYIKPTYVKLLKRVYKDPKDVELVVAGVLEDLLPGAITGPTYNCIISQQFYNTRVGDRFFYENGNQPCKFTLKQLNSIRESASIASLFCKNVDGFDMIQKKGFEMPSDDNPLVKCSSLPELDFSLWKD